ncbi:MAG: hypothetical protein ONA69_06850, partial [candidate division KSB1 bacterium]|nr:hypothetical protein [candidate division KSB1 bacterium]
MKTLLPFEQPYFLIRNSPFCWFEFSKPIEVYSIREAEHIMPALAEIEKTIEKYRVCAAVFISYEAASGFDPSLKVNTEQHF